MRDVLGRAIVVGGGLAGLAATAALRRADVPVLILERDRLPPSARPRPGVPQGGQLHNLLTRAQLHLEELLPGFSAALQTAGGVAARVAADTHVYELGRTMPERELGMSIVSAPRPLIEHVARQLVLADEGVSVLDGTRAIGIRIDDKGEAAGVLVERGGDVATEAGRLVVDASGARSPLTTWLAGAGRAVPPVATARTDYWYASLRVRRPASRVGSPDFWLVFPPPGGTRGALVSPAGATEWHVSVSGRGRDKPPRTWDEVRAHAATLDVRWIADLLSSASPMEPPRLFRKLAAAWRQYDQLVDPVPGLLPIGDAVASLNPLAGQGISVATWQASMLEECFQGTDDVAELTRAFLRASAAAVKAAWDLGAVIAPPTEASPAEDTARARLDAHAELIVSDPDAHRRYVAMWHLMAPMGGADSAPASSRGRISRHGDLDRPAPAVPPAN